MNGRLYDPVVGRMLNPDNFVQASGSTQGYNRYSYCFNNPLKYTDPTGNFVYYDFHGAHWSGTGFGYQYEWSGSEWSSGFGGGGVYSSDGGMSGDNYEYNKMQKWVDKTEAYYKYNKYLDYLYSDLEHNINSALNDDCSNLINVYNQFEGITYQGFWFQTSLSSDEYSNSLEACKGCPPPEGWALDPITEHLYESITLNEFVNATLDMSYKEIGKLINMTGNPSKLRYVINPLDHNVIDMRHMLFVGYQYGELGGKIIEFGQWVAGNASGMNAQDFYSNRLGSNFNFRYQFQILLHPNRTSNYLQNFFATPTAFNHKYRGSIWF